MDNFTIIKILNSNHQLNLLKKQIFLGVYPKDKLPTINNYPSCFILNTDPSNKPGEHWLAAFIDKNKNYFFDSYGNSPSYFGLGSYFSQFKNLNWNKLKLQGDSKNCGLYCILFLLYKTHNKLDQFYFEFNKSPFINDKKLIYLIKKFN